MMIFRYKPHMNANAPRSFAAPVAIFSVHLPFLMRFFDRSARIIRPRLIHVPDEGTLCPALID